MRSVKNKIKIHLILIILKLKKFDFNEVYIITGDPRSGSTWLMELFSHLPKTIINWEPLHEVKGLRQNRLELIDFFEKILTLKIYTIWTIKYIGLRNIFKAKHVITKFVRANQLLPWLVANFDFRFKPVYLIRHPLTTCVSQLKTFKKLSFKEMNLVCPATEQFKNPKIRYNEYFFKYETYINSLKTPLERQVALWCINNKELLNLKSNAWVQVFYEELVLNPKEQFSKLLRGMHVQFDASHIDSIEFSKASTSDYGKSYQKDVQQQLTAVIHLFSNEELIKLQAVLDYFEITCYKAANPTPIK